MTARAARISDDPPLFTVFTATYNRANVLPRAYASLKKQTFRAFEWVIVDDGSSDETETMVESWITAGSLSIQYRKQPHQGTIAALARGIDAAQGEFFVTLDSDDACLPHALETVLDRWYDIPAVQRGNYVGVTGLCVDSHRHVIGKSFPREVMDSSPLEMRYRWRMKGDKWGFQRTAILQELRLKDLAEIEYVPPGVIWSALARRYRTRYVNDALAVCFGDGGNQLTHADPSAFAPGLAYWHRSILNQELDWFTVAPDQFFRSAVQYSRFALHSGKSPSQQLHALEGPSRLLWFVGFPTGAALYVRDRKWRASEPRDHRRRGRDVVARLRHIGK